MAHLKKTLILGTVKGLSLEEIRPFFLSLEKTGYRGDLAILVNSVDRTTLEFLQSRRISLVPFEHASLGPLSKWFRRLSKIFLTQSQQEWSTRQMALARIYKNCARFFYYQSYLKQCGFNYDHVMLADVRDILFQRDPFDFEIPDGLSVFMEDRSRTIGTCISNSTWIRNGFGDAVLKELHDRPISCSGTTIGTVPALLDFLDRILPIFAAYQQSGTIDQATHNYILNKQPPERVRRFDNDSGPILTMANVDPANFRFNEAGLMVNATGRIYNTLHQYDRFPELAKKLIATLT